MSDASPGSPRSPEPGLATAGSINAGDGVDDLVPVVHGVPALGPEWAGGRAGSTVTLSPARAVSWLRSGSCVPRLPPPWSAFGSFKPGLCSGERLLSLPTCGATVPGVRCAEALAWAVGSLVVSPSNTKLLSPAAERTMWAFSPQASHSKSHMDFVAGVWREVSRGASRRPSQAGVAEPPRGPPVLSRECGPGPAVRTLLSTAAVPYFGEKMHFDV